MLRLDAPRPVSFCDGLTRRDFLHAGALAALGLTLPGFLAARRPPAPPRTATSTASCCSWSAAPARSTPGTPSRTPPPRCAARSSRSPPTCPACRSAKSSRRWPSTPTSSRWSARVYHTATAVHDTGHQMMQTGRLFTGGIEHPHVGCVLGYLKGQRGEVPAHVLLPRPIGRTGGNLPHGQTAGYLGKQYDPVRPQRRPVRRRTSRCPTCCRPTTSPPSAPSAARRCATPSTGALAAFEKNAAGQAAGRQFQPGLSPDVQPAGARGVRPGARSRQRCATATAGRASARAACWPAG